VPAHAEHTHSPANFETRAGRLNTSAGTSASDYERHLSGHSDNRAAQLQLTGRYTTCWDQAAMSALSRMQNLGNAAPE
jgi:hypothetical protein